MATARKAKNPQGKAPESRWTSEGYPVLAATSHSRLVAVPSAWKARGWPWGGRDDEEGREAGGGRDQAGGRDDAGGRDSGPGRDSLFRRFARSDRGGAPRFSSIGTSGRQVVGMGWHRDLPDFRDYHFARGAITKHSGAPVPRSDKDETPLSEALIAQLKKKGEPIYLTAEPDELARRHHNIASCSPIEDQGPLGSCTAQAVVGLLEYMMRRARIDDYDGSRLFLYKTTRNLMNLSGDTGAYLRTAMQAAATFGVPPEEYWPYDISRFEAEPSAFLYSYANNFKTLNYARLDKAGRAAADVLLDIKRVLRQGYCVVFGFPVYSSLGEAPDIPIPDAQDRLLGGHAVMAVGYDDDHPVGGTEEPGRTCPSLIIRNSWGARWGYQGYGFLPYQYVLDGLASDFWASFKWDFIDPNKFR